MTLKDIFTTQELKDLQEYCREHNVSLKEAIRESAMERAFS